VYLRGTRARAHAADLLAAARAVLRNTPEAARRADAPLAALALAVDRASEPGTTPHTEDRS
jgi:hypothetical protein